MKEIERLEGIMIYKAVKCDNCKKAFSSTREKRHKCAYCGKETIKHTVIAESERPKGITQTVSQYNYNNR